MLEPTRRPIASSQQQHFAYQARRLLQRTAMRHHCSVGGSAQAQAVPTGALKGAARRLRSRALKRSGPGIAAGRKLHVHLAKGKAILYSILLLLPLLLLPLLLLPLLLLPAAPATAAAKNWRLGPFRRGLAKVTSLDRRAN